MICIAPSQRHTLLLQTVILRDRATYLPTREAQVVIEDQNYHQTLTKEEEVVVVDTEVTEEVTKVVAVDMEGEVMEEEAVMPEIEVVIEVDTLRISGE